jgi:hypothetical protein
MDKDRSLQDYFRKVVERELSRQCDFIVNEIDENCEPIPYKIQVDTNDLDSDEFAAAIVKALRSVRGKKLLGRS